MEYPPVEIPMWRVDDGDETSISEEDAKNIVETVNTTTNVRVRFDHENLPGIGTRAVSARYDPTEKRIFVTLQSTSDEELLRWQTYMCALNSKRSEKPEDEK